MQQLVIFENDPNEYGAHECHPLGYRLVEYLPVEWNPIESGTQVQGVHIVGETPKEAENLTGEEIVERIRAKIRKGGKFVDLHELNKYFGSPPSLRIPTTPCINLGLITNVPFSDNEFNSRAYCVRILSTPNLSSKESIFLRLNSRSFSRI